MKREKIIHAVRECFRELRKEGILARGNAEDCDTCSSHALWKEIRDSDREWTGVVFWNERAHHVFLSGKNDYLWLAYQTREKRDRLQLGRKVVQKLRERGLEVDWDESINKKIGIKGEPVPIEIYGRKVVPLKYPACDYHCIFCGGRLSFFREKEKKSPMTLVGFDQLVGCEGCNLFFELKYAPLQLREIREDVINRGKEIPYGDPTKFVEIYGEVDGEEKIFHTRTLDHDEARTWIENARKEKHMNFRIKDKKVD